MASEEEKLKQEYQDYLDYNDYQEYLKSQQQQESKEPMSELGTLGATAVDELLMNYGAEALGAIKAPFSDLPLKQAYISERDAAEKALLAAQEQNPSAAMAGKVAGIGASLAIPMPALQGGRVAKAAKSAALGASQFLAQDTGSIEGEVMTPPELAAQKVDLVTESPWAAATSTLLPAAFQIPNLKKSGAEMVFGATPPKSKEAQKMIEAEMSGKGLTPEKIGEFEIKSGVAAPFSSAKGILEKTYEKRNEVGQKISDLIERKSSDSEDYLVRNAGKISQEYFDKVISGSNASIIMKRVYDKVKNRPEGDIASEYVANFLERNVGDRALSLPEVQKLKVDLDDMIDWSMPENKVRNNALIELRKILDESINAEFDLLDKALNLNDKAELKKLRSDYQKYSIIYENAKRREARELSKTVGIGLPASVGAAGGAAGGTVSGALVGAGIGAGLGILNQTAQSGRLSTGMGNILYNLGETGRLSQAPATIGSRVVDQPQQSEMSALQRYRLEKQLKQTQGGQ